MYLGRLARTARTIGRSEDKSSLASSSDPLSPSSLLSPARRESVVAGLATQKAVFRAALKESSREASVLLPLCVDEAGRTCLLFQKRSAALRAHSGEVRKHVTRSISRSQSRNNCRVFTLTQICDPV